MDGREMSDARQTAEKICGIYGIEHVESAITAALEAKDREIEIHKAAIARLADCSCKFGCARGVLVAQLDYKESERDEAQAQLDEAVRLLSQLVKTNEDWNSDAQKIIGRVPQTGIYLQPAKDFIARVKGGKV